LVATLKDSRFRSGITMDPWTTPMGPEVYETDAFTRPFMIIDSDKWFSKKKERPFLRCLLSDQVRVLAACPKKIGSCIFTLRETNHQSFTDFMLITGPRLGHMLGLREKNNPIVVLQHIRQLSIAFIKKTIQLKTVPWPQGSKYILEMAEGGQSIDIKHGHRNMKDHRLGYELEVQRLIAFERQANTDKTEQMKKLLLKRTKQRQQWDIKDHRETKNE